MTGALEGRAAEFFYFAFLEAFLSVGALDQDQRAEVSHQKGKMGGEASCKLCLE